MGGCEGGCAGRCGCGERLGLRALRSTVYPGLIEVAGTSAAVDSDCDRILPFGEDRLTDCSSSIGGAHQAHKAEDDRRGGTHPAD